MNIKPRLPSPAMIVALIALFVALGGSALGYKAGRDSAKPGGASASARHHAKYRLRAGKIIDRDTTAHDGNFNDAFGHARCKKGERLISGGLRLRSTSGGVIPGNNVSMVESGPIPKLREWAVTMNSDLGGAARRDFVVFAYCRT